MPLELVPEFDPAVGPVAGLSEFWNSAISGIEAGLGLGSGALHPTYDRGSGTIRNKKKNPVGQLSNFLHRRNAGGPLVVLPKQERSKTRKDSYRQYKKHRPIRSSKHSRTKCASVSACCVCHPHKHR